MPERLVSTAFAAALLRLSSRRLQQLAREGWVTPAARGKWALVSLVQGYLDFLRQHPANPALAALNDVRARQIEQRLAREDRTIVTLHETLAVADDLASHLAGSLRDLPKKITADPRERQRVEAICQSAAEHFSQHVARARADFVVGRIVTPGEADEQ